MILYHFTALENLESIRSRGLIKGDVPTSQSQGLNGVWFTTKDSPLGHGNAIVSRLYTEAERADFKRKFGVAPRSVQGKGDVRIKVVIPSSNRKLVQWARWGRKNCDPGFFATLNSIGDEWRTWWIYFGTIPPTQFAAIDILNPNPPTFADSYAA